MNSQQIGQVILRIAVGVTFLVHGVSKFQGGISNTASFFDSLGVPSAVAYVVAIIEVVGGIMMIVGFGTRIVGALFAIVMAGAIVSFKAQFGFLGDGQNAGYEFEFILLIASVYFMLAAPAPLSVDAKMGRS